MTSYIGPSKTETRISLTNQGNRYLNPADVELVSKIATQIRTFGTKIEKFLAKQTMYLDDHDIDAPQYVTALDFRCCKLGSKGAQHFRVGPGIYQA